MARGGPAWSGAVLRAMAGAAALRGAERPERCVNGRAAGATVAGAQGWPAWRDRSYGSVVLRKRYGERKRGATVEWSRGRDGCGGCSGCGWFGGSGGVGRCSGRYGREPCCGRERCERCDSAGRDGCSGCSGCGWFGGSSGVGRAVLRAIRVRAELRARMVRTVRMAPRARRVRRVLRVCPA